MLVDSNYEIILCEHCSGYGYYYVNLEKISAANAKVKEDYLKQLLQQN